VGATYADRVVTAKKIVTDVLWFLLCGARERLARMGAYGVAGASVAVYSDVIGSRKGGVWIFSARPRPRCSRPPAPRQK